MDSPWLDFDVAVGEWRLGTLSVENLPSAAVAALSVGCDTPSLARLAGMDHATWSELEPVVHRLFQERGQKLPDVEQAVKAVADSIAGQMVVGTIDPVIGSDRLHKLAWRVHDRPAWDDLMPFTALWGHLDAVEAGRIAMPELQDAMVETARELLDRGGVRLSAA